VHYTIPSSEFRKKCSLCVQESYGNCLSSRWPVILATSCLPVPSQGRIRLVHQSQDSRGWPNMAWSRALRVSRFENRDGHEAPVPQDPRPHSQSSCCMGPSARAQCRVAGSPWGRYPWDCCLTLVAPEPAIMYDGIKIPWS